MKTYKNAQHLGFDVSKAYENLREASKAIELEQNQVERDIVFKDLKELIDGRKIVVENSLSLR